MKKQLVAVTVLLALGVSAAPASAARCYNFCRGPISARGQASSLSRDGHTERFRSFSGLFQPFSIIRIDILSTPTFLGTATANRFGNLDVILYIPGSVRSGYHVLRAVGRSSTGEQVTVSAGLRLNPLIRFVRHHGRRHHRRRHHTR